MVAVKPLWFNKSRRAQSPTDYETWIEGGVVPTLNAFDNGDIRATTIVFKPHQTDGARVQGKVINTLLANMGTGGNNMPMVVHPISGNVIGRQDHNGPNGKSFGEDNDPMFTLTSTDRHAVGMESLVRRLTPLECERLQGFPDNWTEGQSDTNRYKQMGNAVAVPVVEWIIQNICDTI